MIRRSFLFAVIAAPAMAAAPRASSSAKASEIRVAIETSAGKIVVAVDVKHAPITATNFLRYVDSGRFNGKTFYRAARSKSHPGIGLIQGGIDDNIPDSFFPIPHEPTDKTGLHHVDGTLSMARNKPGSAMGDFFICVGPAPSLDAAPNYPGYAAFGHVVSGMDVVKRILVMPTYPGGLSAETMGQTIIHRVTIVSAHRLG